LTWTYRLASTEETFSAQAHRTFDGRALAIIRPIAPGPIEVTASIADHPPSTLTLTAS
jgi:hypothetical protein